MKKQFTDMGTRIKSRRKELKMTQGQLAEHVGISNNHMSSIENAKETPSLDTFARICESLNVRPDYLLLGSVSSDGVPQSIVENLQLCNEHDLKVANHLICYMVELNEQNRNFENFQVFKNLKP